MTPLQYKYRHTNWTTTSVTKVPGLGKAHIFRYEAGLLNMFQADNHPPLTFMSDRRTVNKEDAQ